MPLGNLEGFDDASREGVLLALPDGTDDCTPNSGEESVADGLALDTDGIVLGVLNCSWVGLFVGLNVGERVGFFDPDTDEGDNELKLIVLLISWTSTPLSCNAVSTVSFSSSIR